MQKTSRLNRLLAVIVAVFMAVCCLPLSAFAEGGAKNHVVINKHYSDKDNASSVTYDVEYDANGVNNLIEKFAGDFQSGFDGYKMASYKTTVNLGNGVEPYEIPNGGSVLSQEATLTVDIYFDKVEDATDPEPEEPVEPEQPTYYSYTVKVCAEDGTQLADDRTFQILDGQSIYNAYNGSLPPVEGYTFSHFSLWEVGNPISSEAIATKDYNNATVYAVYTKNADPAPATYTVNVQFRAEDGTVLADDRQFTLTEGASIYDAHSGAWPVVDGYTFAHFSLWEISNVLDRDAIATPDYGKEGMTLIAVYTKNAEPAKEYITYKVIDSETREQIATWQVLEGDPLSSYSGTVPKKDGYTLDYLTFIDADKPVDMANTVAVKNLNGGLEWTLEAHFKALPAGYEDVNVRFEFVDMDGKTVLPALNYATTVSDDVIGPKVADVFADMTKQLAEKNYAFHHMTLVYEDGSESSALKDPVIVPDYDGATIKVYFNKVSSGNGGNTSSGSSNNNSSNSNTTTVTATNDNGETVVKAAAAPANNSAKILPQTGLSVETPVVFGVMMVAALAGAGAYLFAIRKKLN